MVLKMAKGNRESFAGIPRKVIDHPDYQATNCTARALLLDLAYQYRGHNNGDLTTAIGTLKRRGWKSRSTIDRAKAQLLKNGLILETRAGRFSNPGAKPSLYALTWRKIDDCYGVRLDVPVTNRPSRTFVDERESS
jgi:hypothetical protein